MTQQLFTAKQSFTNQKPAPITKHNLSDRMPKGWKWIETPGHGYLKITQEANQRIAEPFRREDCTYEEDCAANIPVFYNSELFDAEFVKRCRQNIIDWYPKEWEEANNVILQEGQSAAKDRNYFDIMNNLGKWMPLTAYGDWCYDVPKGMVYFEAVLVRPEHAQYKLNIPAGQRTSFLVDESTHSAKSFFTNDELKPYVRNTEFYRWDDYEKTTGNKRYH